MASPDINALKARVKRQQEAEQASAAPPAPVADKPRITTSTKEMEKFAKEFEELNSPEPEVKVDLGELPEEVRSDPLLYRNDGVVYRGTALDNPKTRKNVEKRCKPMEFGDLILSGRVAQTIPILPGKLEPTFQSLIGKEIFWMERSVHIYAASNMAVASWMGYARLALAMTELNDNHLGDHLNKDGEVDEEKINEKISRVLDMPERFIDMLLVNFNWFNARVEALYKDDFDLLKNG